jgi:RNA polymerase sigma factor (sigma-70 family)
VSDERLAARVASDPTAFAELHERYEKALLRYTCSLLRNSHDAADAAQDAWTRALAALHEEPVRVLSVRAWLFAIARNACMDRLRDGSRCAPADIDDRALGASPAADDVLELRERAREALGDLAKLSERQRAAVVLRDLNGLDGDELARALDTDTRRVSWLLTDARRSLAEVRSGRGLTCEGARRQLETARVRTRAVRAHLAACPDCDGYARRRVAARVHLHGIAAFVLGPLLRLRGVKPLAALAAATVAVGVPVVHELHPGAGKPGAAVVIPSQAPHRRAVTLPAAPAPRAQRHARPAGATKATRPAARVRHVAQRPAWRPAAAAKTAPAAAAPAASPAPAAPAPGAPVHQVAATVTAVAPAAAPLVDTALRALGTLRGDL